MRMKRITVLAMLALLVSLSPAASADTIPVLFLWDVGTATGVVVTDGGVYDSCPQAGCVTYIGGVGNFKVNADSGLSSAVLGQGNQDLNFLAVNLSPKHVTDTLVIYFSTLDNVGGAHSGVQGEIGGVTHGSATWSLFWNDANLPCTAYPCPATGTLWSLPLPHPGFAVTQDAGFTPGGLYSLTQEIVITEGYQKQTGGDFFLHVAEPSALSMLGVGLGGLMAGIRRKLVL